MSQENTQSFGSLNDLLKNAAAPVVETAPAQETPVAGQETAASNVVLNQTYEAVPVEVEHTHAEAVQVSATVEVDLPPVATPVVAQEVEEPTLEAYLEDSIRQSKEEGDTVEVKNAILGVMREIATELKNQGPDRGKIKDILNSISIDLNNIAISAEGNSNPLVTQTQLSFLEEMNSKPYFPVIALKSGYRADMCALNNNEKILVRNIRGSVWDQTIAILRLIHSKIQNTSVGRLTFDRFLQVTAEEDYDTLLYGIYHATFPEVTEYIVTCPHCQTANRLKLNPNNLVEVIDIQRASTYVQEVLSGYNKGEEFLKQSLVAKKDRQLLPDSKMVVELVTPNLQMMLENMKITDSNSSVQTELIVLTKYISRLFVLDYKAAANGQTVFHEIKNRNQFLKIITDLSKDDLSKLRNEISNRIRYHRVEYQIPKFTCADSKCSQPISNSSIDIMRLIFFAIAEEVVGN